MNQGIVWIWKVAYDQLGIDTAESKVLFGTQLAKVKLERGWCNKPDE